MALYSFKYRYYMRCTNLLPQDFLNTQDDFFQLLYLIFVLKIDYSFVYLVILMDTISIQQIFFNAFCAGTTAVGANSNRKY